MSGLSSGAKLELVQSSRSPAVVSVALQLPESEALGAPNARLTDKFPSTTTLWLVLRKFESGVAGEGGTKRNLTARGAPRTTEGTSGQGRLYYEKPVIQVMGRELSVFTELQKTLGELGFKSGSVLLRLSFRVSENPLEEEMDRIEQYFKTIDQTPDGVAKNEAVSTETATGSSQSELPLATAASPDAAITELTESTSLSKSPTVVPSNHDVSSATENLVTSSSGRTLQVFSPPTSTTPTAALTSYNPSDYTPTIEHATRHQRMLSNSTRNVRLPSEAEIAAKTATDQETLAAVSTVEIKVRFPDESSITTHFTRTDTGATLHSSIRECLDERLVAEPFVLRQPGIRGMGENVPDNAQRRLIQDLGLKGRVLVIFGWDEAGASPETKAEKQVLKESLRQRAVPLSVHDFKNEDAGEDQGIKVRTLRDADENDENKGKRKGMPKWLQGLSKK